MATKDRESIEQKAARFANMGRGTRRAPETIKREPELLANPVMAFVSPTGKLMKDMTPEELKLVEIDKTRWLDAWKMYKTWGKRRLLAWLETHGDADYREDIRRRLNVIRQNNSRGKYAR